MSDLTQIIHACQKGKPVAQKELYDRFAPKMYGVCLQYCKDPTEAEDCLQEGFIKVFSKINRFRFEGSFEGWVRRIVVNTIIESFRKKQPTSSLEEMSLVKIEDESMEPMDVPFSEQELLHLIQELPPQYRMVFNLYAIEGLTHNEISEVLNISIGTSKSNLSRARKWLKDRLKDKLEKKKQAVC